MTSVSIFEERHMTGILLYLRTCEAGTARKIDVYRGVSNNPRMPDKLAVLEDAGLVSQTFDLNSRATLVSLTARGETVADLLRRAQEAMA